MDKNINILAKQFTFLLRSSNIELELIVYFFYFYIYTILLKYYIGIVSFSKFMCIETWGSLMVLWWREFRIYCEEKLYTWLWGRWKNNDWVVFGDINEISI